MTIRVVLVDDQELIRVGFRMVLDAEADIEVVAEADDGDTALDTLAAMPSDVVLMDVRMPRMSGVEATRQIVAAGGGPRVLILTTFDLDEYAYDGLRAGASGFLLKDAPLIDLLSSIRHVHSGDAVVAPSTTRRLLRHFIDHEPTAGHQARPAPAALAELTGREREVLVHIARGLSNAEIAERLVLSEGTVKTHVGRILAKLDLRDRVQAVVLAYETGIIAVGDP
ncbi:response regulator [Pseudonocardia nantongensis]|uniref:response regulator n=1 Tax=Pseudonocardia nantongensis TaxID=1181885 RepID=UPI00397E5F9B